MKHFVTGIAIALLAVATVFVAACGGQKATDPVEQTEAGWQEAAEGTFRMPYEIVDTSAIGKLMIGANCADYVEIRKSQGTYTLVYFCKPGILGSIEILQDDKTFAGSATAEGDFEGYAFRTDQATIENKIRLRCVVVPMDKTVEFAIVIDTAGVTERESA